MRWIPIVLLLAGSPLFTAYSGTFTDDFSDGDLDGWDVFIHPPLPREEAAHVVKLEDGDLVIDTIAKRVELPPGFDFIEFVRMELRVGDMDAWNSYTLTCQVKFDSAPREGPGMFVVGVRRSEGHFGVTAQQILLILPTQQHIQVETVEPHAERDPILGLQGVIHHEVLDPRNFRRPIKLKQWLPIKIVAEESRFEFHLDENLVAEYEDENAGPGTVMFQAEFMMVVRLDDFMITGPGIPNNDPPQSVRHEARLATTWGEIKNLPNK
ncbi:MAG: hypothetical protein OXN17_19120 [Candidatus Poribacteria bacterium]|nr:hypothetical protein [Candidatus Poribacteria bacterium]MDE0503946.1 hypothetical protein [Candidatus Poribacteria bacterium]